MNQTGPLIMLICWRGPSNTTTWVLFASAYLLIVHKYETDLRPILSTSWHGAYWLRINSHFPNRLSIISVFSLVSTYNVQVLQLFKSQTVSYLRETPAMSSETCIKILLACCFCIIVIKHARQIIQYLYLPYYLTRKDKKCKTRYEKIVLFK